MLNIVDTLIRDTSHGNQIDEHLFIREQGQLDPQLRRHVRSDAVLAGRLFDIAHLDRLNTDYGFWDNTTLSMKQPLVEYVRDGASVLEVGPGPAATLSLYLYRHKQGLEIVCAEIHPPFLESARQAVALNQAAIRLIHSDMTAQVPGRFDVIFMTPPYLDAARLQELGIRLGSSEAQAGNGGADGSDVTAKVLRDVPSSLASGGVALLGINNGYLEDARVVQLINDAGVRLLRRYYRTDQMPPYSQVYVVQA
ncbi:MAG: ribosomal protein glutamine methyltransferase [Mycobacterium sp.]|nr:ribosomal protein glutamine methyltransferase [Mycobacterium sp.]